MAASVVDVPIVPVAFVGSHAVLPKGAFFPHPGTITIRVGDGVPPPWGDRGSNKVITIEDPVAAPVSRPEIRRWAERRI